MRTSYSLSCSCSLPLKPASLLYWPVIDRIRCLSGHVQQHNIVVHMTELSLALKCVLEHISSFESVNVHHSEMFFYGKQW